MYYGWHSKDELLFEFELIFVLLFLRRRGARRHLKRNYFHRKTRDDDYLWRRFALITLVNAPFLARNVKVIH
jgi:hypothetical protein